MYPWCFSLWRGTTNICRVLRNFSDTFSHCTLGWTCQPVLLPLTHSLSQRNQTLAPPTSVNHNLETAEGTAGKISTALSIFGKCYSDNDIRLIWQSYSLAGSFSNGSARTWLRRVQIIRCDTNHSWQHDLSEASVTTTTSSHKELVRSAWA